MILGLHDAAVFLKQSFLSSPSCAEIISSFFMTSRCFSLHSSFSTSFLPISSGPSSIAGVSHPFSYFSGVSHVFCRKSELFCLQVLYSLYLWLRKEEVIFFYVKRKGFFLILRNPKTSTCAYRFVIITTAARSGRRKLRMSTFTAQSKFLALFVYFLFSSSSLFCIDRSRLFINHFTDADAVRSRRTVSACKENLKGELFPSWL